MRIFRFSQAQNTLPEREHANQSIQQLACVPTPQGTTIHNLFDLSCLIEVLTLRAHTRLYILETENLGCYTGAS